MIFRYITIVLVVWRWRHAESTSSPHQESTSLALQRDGLNWTANVHFCPTSTHQGIFMDILFEEAPYSISTTFGTVASVNKTYFLIVNSLTTVRTGSSFDIPFKLVYNNLTDYNPIKLIKVDNQIVSLPKTSHQIEETTLPFVEKPNRKFIEYGMDSKFTKLIKSESNQTPREKTFEFTKLITQNYLPYSKRLEMSTENVGYTTENVSYTTENMNNKSYNINNKSSISIISQIKDNDKNLPVTKSELQDFQSNLTDYYNSKFHLQNQTDLMIDNISQRLIDRVLNILRASISHKPNACKKQSIASNISNVINKLKNDTDATPISFGNYTKTEPKTVKNESILIRNSTEIVFIDDVEVNRNISDKSNLLSQFHPKYLNISNDIDSNSTSKNELNKIDDIFSVNILNYNTSINNAHRREIPHNKTEMNYYDSIESSHEIYPDVVSSSDNSRKLLNNNSSSAISNHSAHENLMKEDIVLQKLDEKIKEKFAEAEMDPKEIKKIEKEIDKYYSIQVLQEALTDKKNMNNSSMSQEYSEEDEYDPYTQNMQKPSSEIKDTDTEEGCDY